MALGIGERFGENGNLSPGGATGHVYSARNIISGSIEAMNILLPDFSAELELVTRFTAEIRTLSNLDRPNTAQHHTAFRFENQLEIIMQFVEGTALKKLPAAHPMPVKDALNYSIQMLTYAHGKGITRRDVRPILKARTPHGARRKSCPHLKHF
jgi:serine/threonine-protein kinase